MGRNAPWYEAPEYNGLWDIFTELANTDESLRRSILRPHEDVDTRRPKQKDEYAGKHSVYAQRTRLDAALEVLIQFEIALQCDVRNTSQRMEPSDALPRLADLRKLIVSDSFCRYLEAYLYFGVRFLLTRWISPETVRKDDQGRSINRLPWWLETPPLLVAECAGAAARVYPGQKDERNVRVALSFLDGSVRQRLEFLLSGSNLSETLELWIRGLRPDLEGPVGCALEQIAKGLAIWADRQAKYYLYLAGRMDKLTDPLPPRPDRGWGCDHPVVARVALGDLYWISGLLRTEVTSEAKVMGRRVSWLGLLRFRAGQKGDTKTQQDMQGTEEILRQVFGACCDLVQNASELAELHQSQLAEPKPPVETPIDYLAKLAGKCVQLVRRTMHSKPVDRTLPRGWREVYDAELDEVNRQRTYRRYGGNPNIAKAQATADVNDHQLISSSASENPPENTVPEDHDDGPPEFWSERLRTPNAVSDLIGIAMSGGGIRSATFNLGVLQGLQELDLLRQVDYISTVSGGGFTGSWLMANVKRSNYWLGRLTPWEKSIGHLRQYSNYLAPRTGILSMDTWSLGALWLRNTLLIQLTALTWMLVLFTGVYLSRRFFQFLIDSPSFFAGLCLFALTGLVVFSLRKNLLNAPAWSTRGMVLLSAVLPAWLASAMLAARVFAIARANQIAPLWQCSPSGKWFARLCPARISTWIASLSTTKLGTWASSHSSGNFDYSMIFKTLLLDWEWLLLLSLTFAGLLIVTRVSLEQSATAVPEHTTRRTFAGLGIALFSTIVVHLCLCAIVYGCRKLWHVSNYDVRSWFAVATVVPTLVLLTYAFAIFLLIGLGGRACDAAQREWWTRYGAWILASAGLGMALPALVFGGPWLIHWLHHHHHASYGAVASWVATTLGGLLAGKSSRTTGDGTTRTPSLQMLANVGGTVFLVGAAMGAAELLFLFLRAYNSTGQIQGVLYFANLAHTGLLLVTLIVLLFCGILFTWRFDLNVFGLSELYKNRLVRCYLGATRWEPGKRKLQPFTNFDFNDDLRLDELAHKGFRGPFPIVNCSMNLSGSSDLALHTRHSASFTMTPLHCGSAREHVGYRSTTTFAGGISLGQAVAVSGAAASPNMGYNTAPLVALLMTLFNVRLGWWFRNPREPSSGRDGSLGLLYLGAELLGLASERRAYVNVTDGGHFENLGIYELVRRRSQLIIACDAECDETMTFTGLANAIRLCYTDFGAVIDLDLASLRRGDNGLSRTHSAVGMIRYSNGSVGRIIYIKASITGDEDATVTQYLTAHPTFPHETTADQFFKEEQFESYRRLGQHIVRNALRSAASRESLIRIAERLMDTMTPAASTTDNFLQHTRALERIWQHFREQHPLQMQRDGFLMELMGHAAPSGAVVNADITCIGLELLQLMENIFIDLRLDDFWEHPDHRGWAMLFMNWARSPRFRMVWQENHHTFGIRFEHFCSSRLGLLKDEPVLRVSPLTRD